VEIMRIIIDTDKQVVVQETDDQRQTFGLYSKEAFELISHQWLRVGWSQKYSYTFSWLGRPIIQLPEDMVRVQEVIYRVKPDVIVETGIAHGGSLVYYASLCKSMDKGRVIGVDIKIHPHNRQAIADHKLSPYITLVEGNSIEPEIIKVVKSLIQPGETVMVFLDSCHTKEHVLNELTAYHDIVSPGSYIVATDGIMNDIYDLPSVDKEWQWNNPKAAALEFVKTNPQFIIEQPSWLFNESNLIDNITYWPSAWLYRKDI
jgi:cephalosporin hydroxylase